MKKIGLLPLLLLLLFSACRKDVNDVKQVTSQPDPPFIGSWIPQQSLITSSVIGFVVDENQEPVADARIQLGNFNTTTDEYGHFFYNDITMNELGSFVVVEKDGFFKGSRRFFPIVDAKNRVIIELLPKEFSQSFNSNDGANITIDGGASIEFAPNSIKVEGGDVYDGEVSIAAKWLDPSSQRTLDQMPGNLQGVNTLNEEVALATYGMIAVELQGSAGQALNIADNASATLRMPVPSTIQASAPAEIPLWSFYESHGIWAQESTATLQGGVYVGEVSHFSFWNCDAPFPLIKLDFRLIDENGNPLNNLQVQLCRSNSNTGYGYTDANGEVCGKVPANETLELKVSVYGCYQTIFTQTIGPFSSDASLGDITITSASANSTTLTGQLVDCDGDPILNGLVIAKFIGSNIWGNTVYEYTDGTPFEILFSTCDTAIQTVEIHGVNLDDLSSSPVQTIAANGQTDLGDIEICSQSTTYGLELTVDGQTVFYPNAALQAVDSMGSQTTYIAFNSPTGNGWSSLQFAGITAGDYSGNNNVYINEPALEWLIIDQFSSFVVDAYGMVGEEVTGDFSGTVTNTFEQMSVDTEVSGSFRILRQ